MHNVTGFSALVTGELMARYVQLTGWFKEQGMRCTRTHSVNGNDSYTYRLTLTVNASDAMNNTTIQCEFEATGHRNDFNRSAIAKLFVFSSEKESSPIVTISGSFFFFLLKFPG